MEGGGGVHSKFMHILVQEFVSSRKYIVSYLVFFASFPFLRRNRSCFQLILGPYLTAWCVSLRSFRSDINFKHR